MGENSGSSGEHFRSVVNKEIAQLEQKGVKPFVPPIETPAAKKDNFGELNSDDQIALLERKGLSAFGPPKEIDSSSKPTEYPEGLTEDKITKLQIKKLEGEGVTPLISPDSK